MAADSHPLDDRLVIVTGASSGLGLATTDALTWRGATTIMAVRNADKGERVRSALRQPSRAIVMELDVANRESVADFSTQFRQRFERLDLLINNAGVMATPAALTSDGVELQWATNHLGHFALTGLLLDRLLATENSRIVAVASLAAENGQLDGYDPTTLDGYRRVGAYANSKLANLMFAIDLDRRLRKAGASTIALAAHPGVTHTNLVANIAVPGVQQILKMLSRLTTQSVEAGAGPIIGAATDPEASGGQYWGPSGRGQFRGRATVVPVPQVTTDAAVAERLWQQSVELSGVEYLQ